jgi:FkbM family methyltransferase
MITYAQMREDIILHRALSHVPYQQGFYIDIGAYHPDRDSVTKHFYDHGWRGINIEPGAKYFPAFPVERPRDINLQVAVSDHSGTAVFYEMDQISTLEARFADRGRESQTGEYNVEIVTLAEVCEQHAPSEIHFLKIDVEGHEEAVLRGADFCKFRPWVMVIEAKEPNRLDVSTHQDWEHIVFDAGYTFAYADILNRYYVSNEHKDLLQYFGLPADDFSKASDIWRIAELERQLQQALADLAHLKGATEEVLNHREAISTVAPRRTRMARFFRAWRNAG